MAGPKISIQQPDNRYYVQALRELFLQQSRHPSNSILNASDPLRSHKRQPGAWLWPGSKMPKAIAIGSWAYPALKGQKKTIKVLN